MTPPPRPFRLDRQERGRIGERAAAAILGRAGYTIVERNVRCGRTELDIVTRDGPVLVFVEVKARWSDQFGLPEEALTPAKRRNVLRAAREYVAARGWDRLPWRVDVLALRLRGTDVLHWELFRDALEEE